jgi:hypothetical protein
MANLYFQDASADICRQLADHVKITTSEGYYTNVSETLLCSSIMQMQRKINSQRDDVIPGNELAIKDKYGCSNPKRIVDDEYIDDCKGHYESCFGCKKYYCPSDKEIKEHMLERKMVFEDSVKKMQEVLLAAYSIKNKEAEAEELFLRVHTYSARYKESTDIYAEEEARKWAEQQNTRKIFY